MNIFSSSAIVNESYFKLVNDLIVSIEDVIQKVTGKYKNKDEVNDLFSILTVSFFSFIYKFYFFLN